MNYLRPLVAVLVLAAGFFGSLQVASGFEPWNIRHWPGTTPASSPMVTKVGQTGVATYEGIDEYGWNGWANVVDEALSTSSADPLAIGVVINRFLAEDARGQVTFRKAQSGEVPDFKAYAVSTAFLEAKCGGGFATACVYLLNARPVPSWYKAAAMIVWSKDSAGAVIRHEFFHALARACDQYRGGCPRATDGVYEGQFICTGNPDTLMDCGGAARTVTRFDYDTFVTAYRPDTFFLLVQIQVPCGWSQDGFNQDQLIWNSCFQRWYSADGRSFDPVTGIWYAPNNVAEWGACNKGDTNPAYHHCWNIRAQEWVFRGSSLYVPAGNYFSSPPL